MCCTERYKNNGTFQRPLVTESRRNWDTPRIFRRIHICRKLKTSFIGKFSETKREKVFSKSRRKVFSETPHNMASNFDGPRPATIWFVRKASEFVRKTSDNFNLFKKKKLIFVWVQRIYVALNIKYYIYIHIHIHVYLLPLKPKTLFLSVVVRNDHYYIIIYVFVFPLQKEETFRETEVMHPYGSPPPPSPWAANVEEGDETCEDRDEGR